MTVELDLEEELVGLLQSSEQQPIESAARELIVLELYRRGTLSSGKAACLLGMTRHEFLQYSSGLRIPYFALTEEEWAKERASSQLL